jgi:hypothetical protein
MFNSPLEYCTVCRMYVALDQTQRECAAEHDCTPQQPCPLAHLFAVHGSGAVPEYAGDAPAAQMQTGRPAPQR